jgi:hypothetical protein
MALRDMAIKYKVNSFLYLYNDINNNLLLLANVGTFINMVRNKSYNVHFENTLSMTFTSYGAWIHHYVGVLKTQ